MNPTLGMRKRSAAGAKNPSGLSTIDEVPIEPSPALLQLREDFQQKQAELEKLTEQEGTLLKEKETQEQDLKDLNTKLKDLSSSAIFSEYEHLKSQIADQENEMKDYESALKLKIKETDDILGMKQTEMKRVLSSAEEVNKDIQKMKRSQRKLKKEYSALLQRYQALFQDGESKPTQSEPSWFSSIIQLPLFSESLPNIGRDRLCRIKESIAQVFSKIEQDKRGFIEREKLICPFIDEVNENSHNIDMLIAVRKDLLSSYSSDENVTDIVFFRTMLKHVAKCDINPTQEEDQEVFFAQMEEIEFAHTLVVVEMAAIAWQGQNLGKWYGDQDIGKEKNFQMFSPLSSSSPTPSTRKRAPQNAEDGEEKTGPQAVADPEEEK